MAEKKKGKKKGVAVQGEEDEKLTKLQKKVLHWLRDCPVQPIKCYFQDFYLLSLADPGCLSRVQIDFHPGSKNNKKEGEKILFYLFL
jgi:hypothetical protein